MCDIPNSYVGHAQFPCVTCFIRTCDMTHLYVWHASCVGRITWEIHIITHNDRPVMNAWVMTHSFVWHASSLHAMTGLIHMCNMTFRHVWQASLRPHWYVWHKSSIWEMHIIGRNDRPHSFMSSRLACHLVWSCGFLISKCHVTQMNETCHCV